MALLHVVPPGPRSIGMPGAATHRDRTTPADPATLMGELAASLESDVPIVTRIVDGDPAEQIARLAREAGSAAIVMSLGSSAMRRKPGSIAYRVLCLAPVPVLALPETPSGRLHVQYLHQGAHADR